MFQQDTGVGAAFVMQKWTNGPIVHLLNLALGGLLFFGPWVVDFGASEAASANAHASGGATGVLTVVALLAFYEWTKWVTLLLGLWIVASPWLLGFGNVKTAMELHEAVGIFVAVIAASELWALHPTSAA